MKSFDSLYKKYIHDYE